MKTTVKSVNGGSATVDRMGWSLVALEHRSAGEGPEITYYDKNAVYVLGNALIHLAMTMEAEEGGYELCNKVSSGVACTFRKGTKCPDCGPVQSGQGVRCHGDMCAAGQSACPSPKACGVAP